MQPSRTTETPSASRPQMGEGGASQPAAEPIYVLLYDLRVELTRVCSGSASYGSTAKQGDYFDLRGGMIHLPGTQGLSVRSLLALIPFLRVKQRFDPTTDDPLSLGSYDTSLQPHCSCTFKVTRTRLSSIPSGTAAAAPPPGRELVPRVATQTGAPETKEVDGGTGAGVNSRPGPAAGPQASASSGIGTHTATIPVPDTDPTTPTRASISTSSGTGTHTMTIPVPDPTTPTRASISSTSTSRGPHQTVTTATSTSSPSPKGSTPKRARRTGPEFAVSASTVAVAGQGTASESSATAFANTLNAGTSKSKGKGKKKSSGGSGSNRKGKRATSGNNQGKGPQTTTAATTPASGSPSIASQNLDVGGTPALEPAAEIGGGMSAHSFQLQAGTGTGAGGDDAGGHLTYNFPLRGSTTGGSIAAAPAFTSFSITPSQPQPQPPTLPTDVYSLDQIINFDYTSLGDTAADDLTPGGTTPTTTSYEPSSMPQVRVPIPTLGTWPTSAFTHARGSSSSFGSNFVRTSGGMDKTYRRLQDADIPPLGSTPTTTTAATALTTPQLRAAPRPATSIGNPLFRDPYSSHVQQLPVRSFSSFGDSTIANTSTSTSYRMPSTPVAADNYVPWADSRSDHAHDNSAVPTSTSEPALASASASTSTSSLPLQGPFAPVPLRGYGAQLYEREQVQAQADWTQSPGIFPARSQMGTWTVSQTAVTHGLQTRPQSQPVPAFHDHTASFDEAQAQDPLHFLSQPPTRPPSVQAEARSVPSVGNISLSKNGTGSTLASGSGHNSDATSEADNIFSVLENYFNDLTAARQNTD